MEPDGIIEVKGAPTNYNEMPIFLILFLFSFIEIDVPSVIAFE